MPYTFTLNDRVSGGLRQINTESEHVKSAMDGVGQKMKAADALMDATGRSVGALRAKIEALRAEREWIPSDNINAIREYDSEIKSLADEIERVENLTSGQSNLVKWANDISNSIPGIGLLKNPIVQAGAAIVGTAKSDPRQGTGKREDPDQQKRKYPLPAQRAAVTDSCRLA